MRAGLACTDHPWGRALSAPSGMEVVQVYGDEKQR